MSSKCRLVAARRIVWVACRGRGAGGCAAPLFDLRACCRHADALPGRSIVAVAMKWSEIRENGLKS
eukprot:321318-Prymnesium_polylepis.1